ncbi:MAG: sulfotransferase [Pseudomonadota bacterium]
MKPVSDSDPRLVAAEDALARQSYKEAHGACMAVLRDDPKNGRAFVLLGVLTADHNNHQKAIELFDRACGVSPRPDALALKGRSLIALNRKQEAVAAAKAALQLAEHAAETVTALTWDTIGVTLSRAGRHEEAIAPYDRAVSLEPRHGSYHYNRAAALQFLGRMEEAAAAYREAATWNRGDWRALPAAVMLKRADDPAEDIDQLTVLFERASAAEDVDGQLHVGHALAKIYDDQKSPREAMAWLGRAKAAKRQAVGYDRAGTDALFAAAQEALVDQVDAIAAQPTEGDAPIFIVGMPRTGTTLTDRILSSHSAVTSAGELADMSLLIKRAAGTTSPMVLDVETLQAQTRCDAAAVGVAYLRGVRETLGIDGRFTDKMPLNVFFVPFVLRAIPSARVICLGRFPPDTVLSNYRQLFATGFSYYNYSYDLEWTAQYTAHFFRLLAAYDNHLPPGRFQRLSYEGLVDAVEPETRRLLDFAGLPFEEACLSFEKNASPVATASSAQVRQPLYRTALGRWKRYQDDLMPGLDILIKEGLLDPDLLKSD